MSCLFVGSLKMAFLQSSSNTSKSLKQNFLLQEQHSCSPLSMKFTYSLSETSIHTILEHLEVDKTSADKNTKALDFRISSNGDSDLNGFGSNLKCDRNEYIVGMSENGTCGVWDCTSPNSAEQMQPSVLADEVLGREILCTATNIEECDCAVAKLESERKGSDYYFHVEYKSKFYLL